MPRFRAPVLVAAILFAAAAPASAAETLDRILVVVNDEIVTEQDLRTAAEPLIAQYRATLSGAELDEKAEEISRKVMEQLIDDRLIRSAAKRESVKVEETEIDAMMEDVQKKFPSKEMFERVMREQGLSFTKLRERFRDQILNRRMIDLKVRSEISLSPGEVRDYYDAHKDEFRSPDKAKVRQILVRGGETRSDADALEFAKSLVKELDGGADMAELAKKYSEASEAAEGGDMGWIEKGSLIEHLDREIFLLESGKHTAVPVKSQLGYHIFRVEDKQLSQTRSFDQVRNRIEATIFRKKTAEQLEKYLAELRKNAYIAHKT